jgi:hypothetical protein
MLRVYTIWSSEIKHSSYLRITLVKLINEKLEFRHWCTYEWNQWETERDWN